MTDEQMFKLRLKGMTEMLHRLRPERYVYLATCVFFSALAASVIFKAMFGAQVDTKTLLSMFGSSGLVASMTGLALVVFNKALDIVFGKAAKAPAASNKPKGDGRGE
jgi:hypothetical protein